MFKTLNLGMGVIIAASLVACAGDGASPVAPSASPSSSGATTITGTAVTGNGTPVSGQRAGFSGPTRGALEGSAVLRVCVVGTSDCIDVDERGTFELSGDFTGDVELHFTGQGQDVRVTVNNVQPGQTIVVSVSLDGDRGSVQVESRQGGASDPKVQLCHLTGNGTYRLIEVAESAREAHVNHGDGVPGGPVPDDPALVFDDRCGILGPSVDIEKATNGRDADEAPGPSVMLPATVRWTYEVTNTGTVALANIMVSDSVEGAVGCPSQTLAPGASMTCVVDGAAIEGQYANTGEVTAQFDGVTVADSDDSHYRGEQLTEDPEDRAEKVQLCHRTGNGRYRSIEVSVDAVPAHLAHGDGEPGGAVPGSDPVVFFDESCAAPVASLE